MKLIWTGAEASPVVGKWVCSRAGGVWRPGDVGIGLVEVSASSSPSPSLVAGVLFDQFNGASIQMHVAAIPGARWMTSQYLGYVFDYAFRKAKVRKIIGLVGADNHPARRFDEHIGFELEAVIKDAHANGDLLVYSMTPAQCRWLDISIKPESLYHGQICSPTT